MFNIQQKIRVTKEYCSLMKKWRTGRVKWITNPSENVHLQINLMFLCNHTIPDWFFLCVNIRAFSTVCLVSQQTTWSNSIKNYLPHECKLFRLWVIILEILLCYITFYVFQALNWYFNVTSYHNTGNIWLIYWILCLCETEAAVNY